MLSVGTLISSRSRKWYTMVAVVGIISITAVTLLVGQSIALRPTLASTSSPQLDALQSLLSARLQLARPTGYAAMGGLRSQLSTSMRPSPASQPSIQIVAARSNEDTSWLDVYLSYIPHMVYQIADVHAVHTTLLNKGNEAGAYLEYILDNYNALPDVVLFCHGSGSGWHLRDKVRIIQTLKWGAHGFANLRYANMMCPQVWDCHHIGLDAAWSGNWMHPASWGNLTRLQEPLDAKHGISYHEYEDSALINLHWNDAFKGELGPLPEELTSPCCSEFVVTRQRILARPREFYRRLRSWVYLTPEESFLTGKFLEHTWAMIFGEPAVLMPVPECELLDCNVHGGQQRIHGFSLGATETSS